MLSNAANRSSLISVASVVLAWACPLFSETITLDTGRPLLRAAEILEARFGWRVTYEDPPFQHPGDVRDQTDPTYKSTHADRFLAPVAVPITFVLVSPSGVAQPNRDEVFDRLIRAHEQSGNPGKFEVRHMGQYSHIVPTMVKRADGRMAPAASLLDARVSLAPESRTMRQAIDAVLQAVSWQNHVVIVTGMLPTNLLTHETDVGADNLSARDALIRIFESQNRKLTAMGLQLVHVSWALLYQPEPTGGEYYFNAHIVPETKAAGGRFANRVR